MLQFESILVRGDYLGYCERRIRESEDEHERLTWQVVQTLFYPVSFNFTMSQFGLTMHFGTTITVELSFQPEQRSSALLDKLGFRAGDVLASIESFLGRKPGTLFNSDISSQIGQDHPQPDMATENSAVPFYDNSQAAVEALLSQSVDAESFFNNLEDRQDENVWKEGGSSKGEDQGLGTVVSKSGSDQYQQRLSLDARDYTTGADYLIKSALLVGQRGVAVEMCVESDRWSDALLLAATSNDQRLWEKTQVRRVWCSKLAFLRVCI